MCIEGNRRTQAGRAVEHALSRLLEEHLIGQYQLVSSLLVFFAVPSPAGGTQ